MICDMLGPTHPSHRRTIEAEAIAWTRGAVPVRRIPTVVITPAPADANDWLPPPRSSLSRELMRSRNRRLNNQ